MECFPHQTVDENVALHSWKPLNELAEQELMGENALFPSLAEHLSTYHSKIGTIFFYMLPLNS